MRVDGNCVENNRNAKCGREWNKTLAQTTPQIQRKKLWLLQIETELNRSRMFILSLVNWAFALEIWEKTDELLNFKIECDYIVEMYWHRTE